MCVARVERRRGGNQEAVMGLVVAILEVNEQKTQHGGEELLGRGILKEVGETSFCSCGSMADPRR